MSFLKPLPCAARTVEGRTDSCFLPGGGVPASSACRGSERQRGALRAEGGRALCSLCVSVRPSVCVFAQAAVGDPFPVLEADVQDAGTGRTGSPEACPRVWTAVLSVSSRVVPPCVSVS